MNNENLIQKKLIKNLFLFVLMVCSTLTVNSQSQLKKWHFNGEGVDFSSGNPVVYNLPVNTTGVGGASNGIYSPAGDLFYVQNNNLYNRNGQLIDILTNNTILGIGPEIIIVPVPDECKKFYIIYIEVQPYITQPPPAVIFYRCNLYYTEVDMSLNSNLGGISPGKHNIFLETMDLEALASVAVSKVKTNGIRNLYFVGTFTNNLIITDRVIKFDITSTGISSPQTTYLNNNKTNFTTIEVELSHDETMLAISNLKKFGSSDVDVTIIHLDINGNINTNLGNNGVTEFDLPGTSDQPFTGIEFSLDNSKLFVGAYANGVYWIDLVNSIVGGLIPGTSSNNMGDSQLELAFNGWIYSSTSTNQLRAIDPDPVLPVLATGLGAAINFTSNPIIANQHTTWTFNNPAIRVLYNQK